MLNGQKLFDEIETTAEDAFWWLGQHSFVIKLNGQVMLVDPFLTPLPERLVPPLFSAQDATAVSLVCCTHDHPCRALRDTLTLCRQNNIECAVIWMPECSEIRDGYAADVEPVVTRFLDTVQREFDVALINARDWVDNQGFYDSRHLNRQGAVRFTRQLGQQSLPHLQLRTARSGDTGPVLTR